VVGAAASVALGLFVIQRSQRTDPIAVAPPVTRVGNPASEERAIAVLPLNNFAEDSRNEYFADGMTEAITLELARIGGLHVISRTSTMRYKTDRKPMPVIAQELGVEYVVEGSVTRADERVRVTAQLIDAKSDQHIWAQSYDGTKTDILALQARVASAIAAEVKGAAGPVRARRPVDPAVYDVYCAADTRGTCARPKASRMRSNTSTRPPRAIPSSRLRTPAWPMPSASFRRRASSIDPSTISHGLAVPPKRRLPWIPS
jgi:TolB-like protein